MMENENTTIEGNDEYIILSDFVKREISKQQIDLNLNIFTPYLFDIIEEKIEKNVMGKCYYTEFKEKRIHNRLYYKIEWDEKDEVTCSSKYILLDPENKRIIHNIHTRSGDYTKRILDEYGNELLINTEIQMIVDFNKDSFLKLLSARITYTTAQLIIDLRKEGIFFTRHNVRKIINSYYNIYDLYFFLKDNYYD